VATVPVQSTIPTGCPSAFDLKFDREMRLALNLMNLGFNAFKAGRR